jgi:hypothetical protein
VAGIMAGAYDRDVVSGSKVELKIGAIYVNPITQTSVEITISKDLMTVEPTSYTIVTQKLNADYTNNGQAVTNTFNVTNQNEVPKYTISGIDPSSFYSFKVKANRNSDYGDWISDIVKTANAAFNGVVVGSTTSSQKISASKSYLKITAPQVKNEFAVATKSFNAITLPAVTAASSQGVAYATSYYSFGTSLFMDSITTSPKQGSGIGFFTNEEGSRGYFVVIETTGLSASQDRKSIRILKADGTKVFTLKDSQQSTVSTFDGVYGGSQYNLDIRVKVSGLRVEILLYVNGFKIFAIDETSKSNYIIPPTKNVSLLTTSGTVAYDYVYATDIDAKLYTSDAYQTNFYEGQFSNDTLNTSFGDIIYYADQGQDVYQTKKNAVDEFGTTVREIAKASVKFPSRPSFPIRWSTGTNKLVKILGSKLNNFGGEAYVLNNTSTTIPLADESQASFYAIGNTLSPSGQLEYSTGDDDYTNKEPVVFESKWLQNEADVKSLANWIKTNVINKGRTVDMEVFGNPLLKIGDIVSIKCASHGLSGSEKFIVVKISHSYEEGIGTSITCRLIS